MRFGAIILLQIYRFLLSPILHWFAAQGLVSGCRFAPSCSEYAAQSVQQFGITHGSVLALKRLLRCHPFARAGFDPVPDSYCPHSRTPHGTAKS